MVLLKDPENTRELMALLPTVLVIATRNPGKIAEIRELLRDFPVDIKSLSDFGPTPEAIEDGDTFEENAYKKASWVARVLGYPALADDSGLCVDALGGRPGVFSARYGGENLTDADRCQKLLKEMDGQSNRKAAFECVISIAVPDGPALTYEGRCEGELTTEPMGDQGFGYDPLFRYPPLGKTFAQMSFREKNEISHRGKALKEVGAEFDKILKWIDIHTPKPERLGCMGEGQ